MTIDHAERAKALVGTRYRPQGRGAEGLDCIGVIIATFGIEPSSVPRNYALRGERVSDIEAGLRRFFRPVAKHVARPGDVMLLVPARDQLHLAVQTARGFVHADAGLRRVVETPGEPGWAVLGCYRFRARRKRN